MKIIIFFLSLLLLAQPAMAKKKPKKQTISSIINLYGATFSHGSPPWLKGVKDSEDLLSASKFYKKQTGPTFLWESIPSDETFETWKTIYAIFAIITKKNPTLTIWEDNGLSIYKKICEFPEIKYLIMGVDASLVQVVCPKVINVNKLGYSSNIGEVGLFAFMKIPTDQGTVFIRHYVEWRGKNFNFSDRKEWPVDESTLKEAILDIKKASAFTKNHYISFK